MVQETLRQICVRNLFGNNALASYLYGMKVVVEGLAARHLFDETELERHSEIVMTRLGIGFRKVQRCYFDSFVPKEKGS
jgi:hypothetical protein